MSVVDSMDESFAVLTLLGFLRGMQLVDEVILLSVAPVQRSVLLNDSLDKPFDPRVVSDIQRGMGLDDVLRRIQLMNARIHLWNWQCELFEENKLRERLAGGVHGRPVHIVGLGSVRMTTIKRRPRLLGAFL